MTRQTTGDNSATAKPKKNTPVVSNSEHSGSQIDPATQKLINEAYQQSFTPGEHSGGQIDSLNSPGAPPTDPTTPTGVPKPSNTGQLSYDTSDIDSLLNSIYSTKTPNFLGDATKQAATIYAPVLKDLTNQGNSAVKRAASNTTQLNAMYGALGASIGQDAKSITDNTNHTVAGEAAATGTASDAIGHNFDAANTDVANLMAKLGLGAAASDVLPHGAEHEAFLQGIVQNQGNSQQALAKQLGANAQNFNTAQQNIAGFEGAQNVKANQQNLGNTLAALSSTRANVGTQQASKASDLAQALQSQYTSSLNTKANALVQQYAAQQQFALAQMNNQTTLQAAQIKANATAAAAAQQGQPTAYQQYEMTDPGTKIYADAAQTFGSGGDSASRAVSLASSVAGKQYPNAQAYAEAVVAANNAQSPEKRLPPDKLRSLAYTMYTSLNNNPNPLNFVGNG